MAKLPDEVEVKVRAIVEMVSDRCEWEITRLRRLLTEHGIDPDERGGMTTPARKDNDHSPAHNDGSKDLAGGGNAELAGAQAPPSPGEQHNEGTNG